MENLHNEDPCRDLGRLTGEVKYFLIKCNPIASFIAIFKQQDTIYECELELRRFAFKCNNQSAFGQFKLLTDDYYYRGRTVLYLEPSVFVPGEIEQFVIVKNIKKGDLFEFRFLDGDYNDSTIILQTSDNSGWKTIISASITSGLKSLPITW